MVFLVLLSFSFQEEEEDVIADSKNMEDFKKKYDISLGFMGFFVKAVVEALQDVPSVNAQIDGTRYAPQ